jgi:hypothetical protein
VGGTYEFIKIGKSGTILDGHHRLKAVIKADMPVEFQVVFDVDDSVFSVLDTGKSRNASDVFRISGITHNACIPPIISMYHYLKKNKKAGMQKNEKLTNAQILEIYQSNESFWQEITRKTLVFYNAFSKVLTPSVIGGFLSHLSLYSDKVVAEKFMKQLTTGANIENGTILLLRDKLIADKISVKKMTLTYKYAIIIKCWNFFRQNISVKVLKIDFTKEEFPKFIY